MFVKDQNFGQKSKVSSKIKTLIKNQKFGQTFNFHQNFDHSQTSWFLTKFLIFDQNFDF